MKPTASTGGLSLPAHARTARLCHVERLHEVSADRLQALTVPERDMYRLVYLTHGAGSLTVDFQPFALQADRLFFLQPGQMHRWQALQGVEGLLLSFNAAFYEERFPDYPVAAYSFFSNFYPPALDLVLDLEPLLPLLQALETETQQVPPNHLEVSRSYLHLLLQLAARHYRAAHAEAVAANGQITSFDYLINLHYRTQKALREYADQLHLSPNHLNALCQRVLRKTASDRLHERVVLEAKRLLASTSQSVHQIATALGFADASYFGRYFKKYVHLTPQAYREQVQ